MLKLPVCYSVISSDALIPVIKDLYEIGDVIECRFLTNGLNDTYGLKTAAGKYILRIYKADWRSKQDIMFEIELLNHLNSKEIPVSVPVIGRSGEYLFELFASEGRRFAVLFTYLEGSPSNDIENAKLYGEQVAKLHLASDDFKCDHQRFTIDLNHLLEQPIQTIRKFLSHRPEDMDYLDSLSALLSNRIHEISPALEWGVCHGDLHGGNVHFHENSLSHFDFDCGGFGWRAYDISVFLWAKVRGKAKEHFTNDRWEAFFDSYQMHKVLPESELKAIPHFVAIREIWLMGLHTGNSHIWGGGWQNDRYFNTNIKFLRDWCEEHAINE